MHKGCVIRYQGVFFFLKFFFGIIVFGSFLGCEDEQRFKVPESAVKRKVISPLQRRHRAKGSVHIPLNRELPLWTEMVSSSTGRAFRSELVQLQGVRWSREGSSRLYDFYFQEGNILSAQTLQQVADRLAFFISRWTSRPFQKRISVILVPWKAPSVFPVRQKRNEEKKTSSSRPVTRPSSLPTSLGTRKSLFLKVPDVGGLQIVLFTGSKEHPVYSRYGLISVLLEKTIRLLLSGKSERKERFLWRSVGFPDYFSVRGSGAMIDRSYDRTSARLFRSYLRKMGRPNVKDALELLHVFQRGKLPQLLQLEARRVAMSFLGFVEDAYGRGVLAALLRDLLGNEKRHFSESLQRVIGKKESLLWQEWFRFYYVDQWKRVLQGQDSLSSLPMP